jgi:hypothetical protein
MTDWGHTIVGSLSSVPDHRSEQPGRSTSTLVDGAFCDQDASTAGPVIRFATLITASMDRLVDEHLYADLLTWLSRTSASRSVVPIACGSVSSFRAISLSFEA